MRFKILLNYLWSLSLRKRTVWNWNILRNFVYTFLHKYSTNNQPTNQPRCLNATTIIHILRDSISRIMKNYTQSLITIGVHYDKSWTAAIAGIFSRNFCVTATRTVMTPAAGPVIRTLTIGSSIPTSSRDPPAAPTR